jgi:hypothetical protein
MRSGQMILLVVGGVLVSFLYFWLAGVSVGYSAVVAKPSWWANLIPLIGRHAAGLAWLELLNTTGMALAALLVAIPAVVVLRQGALPVVLLAGIVAGAFSAGETAGLLAGAQIPDTHPIVNLTDTIKLAILPGLLVLALMRWPYGRR